MQPDENEKKSKGFSLKLLLDADEDNQGYDSYSSPDHKNQSLSVGGKVLNTQRETKQIEEE